MVPRELSERDKRHGVPLSQLGILFFCCPHVGQKLLAKKPSSGNTGLKRNVSSQYLASIIPRNPVGSDLFRAFVDVQVSGAIHTSASIRKIDGSFRIMWEIREKLLSYLNDFVRLTADRGYATSKNHIFAITIH